MYEPDKAEECPGACPALFRAWGRQGNRTLPSALVEVA